MPFRPSKKQPSFAGLKAILAQYKEPDNALYQTIQELIERLTQFQIVNDENIKKATTDDDTGTLKFASRFASYLTKDDESLNLPNSLRLLASGGNTFIEVGDTLVLHGVDINYLGLYFPGTYNKGDIVIYSDGIVYLCVKDNTTTPPETWPGVG